MAGFIHTGLYLLSTFPALSHRPISGLLETCPTQGPPASSSGPVGAPQFGKLCPPLSFPPTTLPKPYTTLLTSLSTAAHSRRTRFLTFTLCFSHFLVLGLKGRYFAVEFMTCQFSPAVRTGTNMKTGFITPRARHQDAVKWGQGSLPWGHFWLPLKSKDPTDCMIHSENYPPKGPCPLGQ